MSHSEAISPLPPVQKIHYPSDSKKKISIKKEGDGVDLYVHFKFVYNDSKKDIHEEISKCFNIERFSLRDSEGNFITGSYESLERDKCYDIIDRSGKRSGNFYSGKSTIKNEGNLASDDASESVASSELSKSIEDGTKQKNSKNVKVRKRKESTQRAHSVIPSLQIKKRRMHSSQNSPIEQSDNIITSEKSDNKKKIKSTQTPRACSRCRQIKKRCDRERPCGRCTKSNLTDSCDAGKTDEVQQ